MSSKQPQVEVPTVPFQPIDTQPVRENERVQAVDILRGVALLGILVMNIPTFAWPEFPGNPREQGPFTGLDRAIWLTQHVVFDTKMMTIFSMLFGAGLVLMSDRAVSRGASLTRRYYRRVLWLMAIGALHGYFIWMGDILFWYGACGLIIYPMRNLRPRVLIGVGLAMNLLIAVLGLLFSMGAYYGRTTAENVARAEASGRSVGTLEKEVAKAWDDLGKELGGTKEKQAEERARIVAVYRGGYLGILKERIPQVMIMQLVVFPFFAFWVCGGRMVIGMGLMRLGIFTGDRPSSFYVRMAVLAYVVGLPLVLLDVWTLFRDQFQFLAEVLSITVLNHLGGLAMALGHAAVVMLAFKACALPRLQRALGAVGRMALTNYLTHGLVLSTLFYGYGFGWFDRVDRTGQMGIVIAIWAFQLVVSPIWLRHFQFGPAEWVWRSLTYGKAQPIWA